jgi:hypothetical protein
MLLHLNRCAFDGGECATQRGPFPLLLWQHSRAIQENTLSMQFPNPPSPLHRKRRRKTNTVLAAS